MGRRHEVQGQVIMLSRLSVNDIFAALLTLILGLNLNGLLNLLFGANQVFSGPIFLLSAALIFNIAKIKIRISLELVIFVLAVLSYLFIGSFYYSHLRSVNLPESYFRTYLSSLVVIFALASYVASLASLEKVDAYFRFVRNVLLLSAVSVLFSPFLYSIYSNPPPSSAYRMGGFFGNPNEAAMASLLAFALVVGFPFRSKTLHWFSIALVSSAIVLSFSKTGILVLVFLGAIYLFIHGGWYLRFVYFLFLLIFSLLFLEPESVLNAVVANPFVELDQSQEARIRTVLLVLTGSVNEDVTTGRSFLWALAMERIADALPGGQGLGSMHHLIGGINELGTWQGAHNTFLMIAGESGLFPALLLTASLSNLFLRILRNRLYVVVLLSVGFVLLVDMLVTHGALGVRYHNLLLALTFGVSIPSAAFRSESILRSS